MVNSWADYRTNFGGKLASWISNTDNQEENIKKVLFGYTDDKEKFKDGHEQELENLRNTLSIEDDSRFKQLNDIVNESITINKGLLNSLSNKNLEVYDSIFAELRTKLNEYIQIKNPDAEEKELKKERKKYEYIFKTIPQLPSFPGEMKKEKMKKMCESKYLLEYGVRGIMEIHEIFKDCKLKDIDFLKDDKGKIDSVTVLKRFDTLCGMYNRESTTPYAKDIVEKAVKHVTGVDIKTMKENEVFSSYKRRGKWIEVELSKSIEEMYAKFPELLEYLKVDFSKRSINDIPEYLDAVEIEKIRFSIMTMFFDTEIRKEKMKKLFSESIFNHCTHIYIWQEMIY